MSLKYLAVVATTVLCFVGEAVAAPTHPTDTNAILIDSFSVHVLLPWSAGEEVDLTTPADDSEIEHIVTVWSTSNGIELVGDVSSTVLQTTEPEAPDAHLVFGAVSRAAVDSALAHEIIDTSQQALKVYQSSTIEVSVTGTMYSYATCTPGGYAVRVYDVTSVLRPNVVLLQEDECSTVPPSGCTCTSSP